MSFSDLFWGAYVVIFMSVGGAISLLTFLRPFQVIRAYFTISRGPQRWIGLQIPEDRLPPSARYVLTHETEELDQPSPELDAWLRMRGGIRYISGVSIALIALTLALSAAMLIRSIV